MKQKTIFRWMKCNNGLVRYILVDDPKHVITSDFINKDGIYTRVYMALKDGRPMREVRVSTRLQDVQQGVESTII